MRACLWLLPLICASCGLVRDWRELRTAPMPIGEAYEGLEFVAVGDGFTSDTSVSDRGFGIWQSRWRQRVLADRYPGRYRLRAEILVDEGSPQTGWPIRYVVDQEKVKDLRRAAEPRDEDYSANGQDREREAILGEKLQRRLAPQSVQVPPRVGRAP